MLCVRFRAPLSGGIDQIINNAAKMRQMTDSLMLPIVFVDQQLQLGQLEHAPQALENWFANTPVLKW
jgi:pyruvate dehydrogenase E1 component beta subunit